MTAGATAVAGKPQSLWNLAARRFLASRAAIVGALVLIVIAALAIMAPVIAPFDPYRSGLGPSLSPPSAGHPAGLDKLGRDVLSRVLYGARLSILTGIAATLGALLIGGIVGAIAGASRGRTDAVLMRIVDVILAFPGIMLAIGIVTWLGQGLPQITLAVAITAAPVFARLLRGSLLALHDAEYVKAAGTIGVSPLGIFWRHMLPNSLTPLVVAVTLTLATSIIEVAGLGFLGLGPADPRVPEWGTMLTDGADLLRRAPHVVFAPAFAIAVTAIAINLVGDGLREALDPRVRM
jgi:ABC-type dipeptide/oligopeptide/nickel transport system permease subunit